jgi:hypothetical protein
MTERASGNDLTPPSQRPVNSSKLPEAIFIDWMHPFTSDLTRPAFGPTNASYVQPVNIDRTLTSASDHSMTSVWSVFLSEKHFRDFATFSTLAQMC